MAKLIKLKNLESWERHFFRVGRREELTKDISGSVIYYQNKELFPEEGEEHFEISIPTCGGGVHNYGEELLRYGAKINRLEHCKKFDRLDRSHLDIKNENYQVMPCFTANGLVWDVPRMRVVGEPNEEEAKILADLVERLHFSLGVRKAIKEIKEGDRRKKE